LRLGLGAAVAAVALSWRRRLARAATAPAARTILYVQPLGAALPAVDVALVREALVALIGLDVRVLPAVAMPEAAYYPARRRYRADRLLPFLNTRLPGDGARILGLTAVDISTTKGEYPDWGVLGLGELPGKASVISLFRCRRRSSGPENARQRLAKVAVHELGHTLGLAHCPNVGCLMEDAEGQVATCDREYDFCPRCRGVLAAGGQPLPSSPRIPWPRPPI
jgi:archaemetzincin